ncbi:hypothetical protein ACO1J7_12690 [Leptospira interrogans serovar Australis]
MIFIILVAIGIILIVASGSFLIQTKKDSYEKALALAALGNYVVVPEKLRFLRK